MIMYFVRLIFVLYIASVNLLLTTAFQHKSCSIANNTVLLCRVYAQADSNHYSALPRRGDNQNIGKESERYSAQMAVSQADHYKTEDPYEWVAPRKTPGSGNPRFAGRMADRQSSETDRQRVSGQFSPTGKSFMNQMYMDHSELQKLKQQSQMDGYRSDRDHGYHSSKEGYQKEPAYTSPGDRPR